MADRKKRLEVMDDRPGPMDRHPDDGWEIAEPFPLDPRSRRALGALIDALLPEGPRTAGSEEEIALHVRRMMRYMPLTTALGLVASLHLLEWSPLWRLRGIRPLSGGARGRATRLLRELSHSRLVPIRTLVLGPRALVLSTFYDRDEVHAALEYEPRAFIRERIALRERLARGENREQDAIPLAAPLEAAQAHPAQKVAS
ncbi:MAG: hypothetical protein OEY14_01890 [Myxococcales bacterium]|nr:hypothetical protein [Myxococcales bacterium]